MKNFLLVIIYYTYDKADKDKVILKYLYNKEQICVSVYLSFYAFELWTHIRNRYDQEGQHWPFIFLKSDQWLNYRRKGYATSAFLWGKFYIKEFGVYYE